MNFYLRLGGLGATLVIVFFFLESNPVSSYIAQVKQEERPAFFYINEEDRLRTLIHHQAQKINQEPINARIDSVWKAIPGYNGLVVDEKATFQQTWSQKDRTRIRWVMRERPPRISLEQLKGEPIYRGHEQKKAAALMINVAWGTEHLPGILSVLKDKQVKATFFLDGSWLKKHPAMARQIATQGHEIGNHAYSHPLMSQISVSRMEEEIGKTEALIGQHLKRQSRWFAPPSGDMNQTVIQVAEKFGMKTVLWTVDTIDWQKSATPEKIVQRVRKGVGNGSLILAHPTDRTLQALPSLIEIVRQKGLHLLTVSELLSSKRLNEKW